MYKLLTNCWYFCYENTSQWVTNTAMKQILVSHLAIQKHSKYLVVLPQISVFNGKFDILRCYFRHFDDWIVSIRHSANSKAFLLLCWHRTLVEEKKAGGLALDLTILYTLWAWLHNPCRPRPPRFLLCTACNETEHKISGVCVQIDW